MPMPVRRCLQFLPSQIAAAAVLLAQHVLGAHVWSPTLQHYSGYLPSELQVHTCLPVSKITLANLIPEIGSKLKCPYRHELLMSYLMRCVAHVLCLTSQVFAADAGALAALFGHRCP